MYIFDKDYSRKFINDKGLDFDNLKAYHKSFGFTNMIDLEAGQLIESLEDFVNKSGIYIYENESKILYIGKAKDFSDRILSHLQETKKTHKNCPVFWQLFFNHFVSKGNIKITLIEVKDEIGRLAIEACYQLLYEPKFDKMIIKFKDIIDPGRSKNPRIKDPESEEFKYYENKFNLLP